MKLPLFWRDQPEAFHVRLGGCGGCALLVDTLLRDGAKGAPAIAECSSPRHARVVIATGSPCGEATWSDVIEAAPIEAATIAAGDCALGDCPFERGGGGSADCAALEADVRVPGCPVDVERLIEEVRRVTGKG